MRPQSARCLAIRARPARKEQHAPARLKAKGLGRTLFREASELIFPRSRVASLRVLLRLQASKIGKQARQIQQAAAPSLAGLFEGNAFYFPFDTKPGQHRPTKARVWFMLAGFRKANPVGHAPARQVSRAGFHCGCIERGFHFDPLRMTSASSDPHREQISVVLSTRLIAPQYAPGDSSQGIIPPHLGQMGAVVFFSACFGRRGLAPLPPGETFRRASVVLFALRLLITPAKCQKRKLPASGFVVTEFPEVFPLPARASIARQVAWRRF